MAFGRARLRRALVASVAAGALLAAHGATAWEQDRTDVGAPHQWARRDLTWRVAAPVPATPGGGTRELAAALHTWTTPACADVRAHASAASAADIELVAVATNWSHEGGDAAYTVTDVDRWTGALREARIEVNVAALAGVDLESLLLHEVGHALGLGHVRERMAVMFPGLPAGVERRVLAADDAAGVCALYPRRPVAVGAAAGGAEGVRDGVEVRAQVEPWWAALAGGMAVLTAGVGAAVWWRHRRGS